MSDLLNEMQVTALMATMKVREFLAAPEHSKQDYAVARIAASAMRSAVQLRATVANEGALRLAEERLRVETERRLISGNVSHLPDVRSES